MERPDYLPEGFGTMARHGWNEIITPEPVPFRPLTVGWTLLALIVLVVAAAYAHTWLSTWQRNAYRRAALRNLSELRKRWGAGPAEATLELSALLKRTALAAYPRNEVASLSGAEWLEFLNDKQPSCGFTGQSGELLLAGLFHGVHEYSPAETEILFQSANIWIRRHHAHV